MLEKVGDAGNAAAADGQTRGHATILSPPALPEIKGAYAEHSFVVQAA